MVARLLKLILTVLIAGLPGLCYAQLELYGKFNRDGSSEPIINYAGNKRINDKFAVVYFGLLRRSWGQALIGLSYRPVQFLTLAGYVGIEHGRQAPRYSASIDWEKGATTALLLGELGSGEGNYLYKISISRQLSENMALGIMDWRYHGLGPNFRYTITRMQSTLWIMPAYDHEQKTYRTMIGYSLRM